MPMSSPSEGTVPTKIDIPNDYAVEIARPDISAYQSGNIGIPYVWQFDSGARGPHALISAIVHGNELCGAIALDWLLSRNVRPVRGVLTLAFMNVAAYEAFDPRDANASRWIEEDFNRVWDMAVLDGPRRSVELARAREVRATVASADYLLDIHSMQHPAPPLALAGIRTKGRDLAVRIGTPEIIIVDQGHAAGRRMRDHGAFDDPEAGAAAVLVECGQHWAAATGELARVCAVRFLDALGMAPDGLLAAARATTPPPPQRVFEVTDAITIEAEAFKFASDFRGGEILPDAGTLIGWDGDKEIITPYPDCMLVMPSQRLWRGQTAVRLARAAS